MKKHSKIKALILCTLATVLNLAQFPGIARAADDELATPTASISPVLTKVTLQPGDSYKASFKLANTGGDTLKYKVYATPYGIASDDESYQSPNYSDTTKYSKISEWIMVDESDTSGSLEPLAEASIKYTINVPEDASPGGQYAAIVVERTNADGSGISNASVTSIPRVAYLVYATVAGQANHSGSISRNDIASVFLSSPISATSLVENTGNVHSDAEYILQVYPLFSDEEVYTNEENPETRIILPETRRFITQVWDGSPSIGIFKVKQTVKFAGTESVTEKLVVVCPMWLLFAIVFIIIFLVIWFVMRHKSRKSAGKNSKNSKSSKNAKDAKNPQKSTNSTGSASSTTLAKPTSPDNSTTSKPSSDAE